MYKAILLKHSQCKSMGKIKIDLIDSKIIFIIKNKIFSIIYDDILHHTFFKHRILLNIKGSRRNESFRISLQLKNITELNELYKCIVNKCESKYNFVYNPMLHK